MKIEIPVVTDGIVVHINKTKVNPLSHVAKTTTLMILKQNYFHTFYLKKRVCVCV